MTTNNDRNLDDLLNRHFAVRQVPNQLLRRPRGRGVQGDGGAMILIRTNTLGSDGHLLFPQRSQLSDFPTVESKDADKWGTYRTEDTVAGVRPDN